MKEHVAIISTHETPQQVIDLVVNSLNSEHSKRAYQKALDDFMTWYVQQGKPGLTKAIVQSYRAELQEKGLSSSTINLRMSAIRKLAQEAADNGMMEQALANGIGRVKGVKSAGVRAGNWLTLEQAQQFLNTPDITKLKGLRDCAILAVMLGCGLRRSEVANLTHDHIQQREGRWVIVDLVGKGNRVRTVPMPSWAKSAVDAWVNEIGTPGSGRVFRAINKADKLAGGRVTREGIVSDGNMTPQAIANMISEYARMCGFDNLAAHDLRRTFAKLAHKGGSGLDQIQLSLGHASIKTTEKYLGVEQDLTDAPCDRLGLRLGE
jgi:site-specific recombinase XerD